MPGGGRRVSRFGEPVGRPGAEWSPVQWQGRLQVPPPPLPRRLQGDRRGCEAAAAGARARSRAPPPVRRSDPSRPPPPFPPPRRPLPHGPVGAGNDRCLRRAGVSGGRQQQLAGRPRAAGRRCRFCCISEEAARSEHGAPRAAPLRRRCFASGSAAARGAPMAVAGGRSSRARRVVSHAHIPPRSCQICSRM